MYFISRMQVKLMGFRSHSPYVSIHLCNFRLGSNWVTTRQFLWMPHLAPMRWSTNCSHWCMIWPSSHRGANHLGHHESTNMWKFGGVVRCLANKSRIANATLETILFHYGWCPTRILNIVVGYTLSNFIFGNLVNWLKDETMLKHADTHKKKIKK
jgi:hypothetical protein